MIDVRGTAIWPPHTTRLGLQLPLSQNVFLLHGQDELLFKDGSMFAGEGRRTVNEAKVTGATTCYGR